MSIYPELLSSTTRELNGIKYFVRRFGIQNIVIEEEYVPVPENKIIHILNTDGTEDISRLESKPDPQLMAIHGKVYDKDRDEWIIPIENISK